MIATDRCRERHLTWQSAFLEMLPEIERRLGLAFCRLDEEAREDAVQEAVVHCLRSFMRVFERGQADRVTASTLAWYAALQVKQGRPAACRMSGSETLSRYAQLRNKTTVQRLTQWCPTSKEWIELMVFDKRSSIADQVAAKLDVGAWVATLTRRMVSIVTDLAHGHSTSEVARRHGVTAGRISQFRRMLEQSWAEFQHESSATVR